MCVCVMHKALVCLGEQRTICRSEFSSSTFGWNSGCQVWVQSHSSAEPPYIFGDKNDKEIQTDGYYKSQDGGDLFWGVGKGPQIRDLNLLL